MYFSAKDENKVLYQEKPVVKMVIKTSVNGLTLLFSHADRCIVYALLTCTDAPTPTPRRQACQRDYYAEIRAKLCLISPVCVRALARAFVSIRAQETEIETEEEERDAVNSLHPPPPPPQ